MNCPLFEFAYFVPSWPLPRDVKSVVTVRQCVSGQAMTARTDKLLNVLDEGELCRRAVERNRLCLAEQLALQHPLPWLVQEHGIRVIDAAQYADLASSGLQPRADACVSRTPGLACVIQSADCLPVLFSSDDGSVVAAAHAGWRGLAKGVLGETVQAMGVDPAFLSAYLGPGISQAHFEVGAEVKEAFLEGAEDESGKQAVEECFLDSAHKRGHFFADLYQLARLQLRSLGVSRIYGGDCCTYVEALRFYSYRREGQTGRMASLIWIEA